MSLFYFTYCKLAMGEVMHPVFMMGGVTLRERKRARTRQALVEAATDLFERYGYDETTIADIAAAADLSKRAFFGHFVSKEDLLFPESDTRVRAAIDAIISRGSDEGPVDVLLRALSRTSDDSDDLTGRRSALRLRLIRSVPSVCGRALQLQLSAQREIARHLVASFPDDLDDVTAAALTGAFIGAVSGALDVLLERSDQPDQPLSPDEVQAAMQRATNVALAPWLTQARPSQPE